MEYYSHHIGDFLSATMHLTHEERSVYLGLMWMFYDKESPIESSLDKLARRLRTDPAVVDQILEEFFEWDGVAWRHGRIEGEIDKYQAKLAQASQAGKASARARRVKRASVERSFDARLTDAQPTNNHKPTTNNHRSSSKKDEDEALPSWLNKDSWCEFVQHRREMRQPLTTLAANKALKKLEGLTAAQQADCIDNTIQNRWRGLFPEKIVKEQGGKANGKLILPRDDERLWDFAKQHGLPGPGQLTYPQYRARLQSEIEKRNSQ